MSSLSDWIAWLTEDRLARWNHIRFRASLEPLTREQGARILSSLAREKKLDVIDEIKERIAE